MRGRSTSFAPELEMFCTRQVTRNLRPPNPILPGAKSGKRGSFLRSCTSILLNLRQQTDSPLSAKPRAQPNEFHADTMHGLPDGLAVMNVPIASDHEIERFGKTQWLATSRHAPLSDRLRTVQLARPARLNSIVPPLRTRRRDVLLRSFMAPASKDERGVPARDARHLFQRF